MNRAWILDRVCQALLQGDKVAAAKMARDEYPFEPYLSSSRTYTKLQCMQIFLRDGFIDRYTGNPLVFPGTLRLLGHLLPEAFPAHPHWKMSESHLMYWELFPTIDHIVPIARGGADEPANWVCTSMLKNQVKSGWLLEELDWHLHPPGRLEDWDGLTHWFLRYADKDKAVLKTTYFRRWYSAAKRAQMD